MKHHHTKTLPARATNPPLWLLCLAAIPFAISTYVFVYALLFSIRAFANPSPLSQCAAHILWAQRTIVFTTSLMVLLPCRWIGTTDSRPLCGLGSIISGITILTILGASYSILGIAGFFRFYKGPLLMGQALAVGAAAWTIAGAVQFILTARFIPKSHRLASYALLGVQCAGAAISLVYFKIARDIADAAMAVGH